MLKRELLPNQRLQFYEKFKIGLKPWCPTCNKRNRAIFVIVEGDIHLTG